MATVVGAFITYRPRNDRDDHMDFVAELMMQKLGAWTNAKPQSEANALARRDRAAAQGARVDSDTLCQPVDCVHQAKSLGCRRILSS